MPDCPERDELLGLVRIGVAFQAQHCGRKAGFLRNYVEAIVATMEKRMGEFGFGWKDATAAQTYTVHDFHAVFAEELVRRGAARSGLTWHFARPPVIDLEYEMDCRRVLRETVI